MRDAPPWWDWPFVLGDHVLDRMPEREFNEVELREMIEASTAWLPDHVPGRFVLMTTLENKRWEVIVEPEEEVQIVWIVTAYRVERS